MKNFFLWLHKWLGLFTGIIVLIISLTGCIYVFQDELKLIAYPEKYFIDARSFQHQQTLPLSKLIAIAEKKLNTGEKISRIDVYPQKNRTWAFRAVKTNKNAFFYSDYFIYHKRVFIDPYSGKVQNIENAKTEFFQVVLQLHMNLLLGKKYGHQIIGLSVGIFAIICLSGLILWWPKKWKRKKLKQQFTVKLNANRKRLNYDLHNVLGFYSIFFALLFALTGLMFTYPALKKGVTKVFNSVDQKENSQKEVFHFIPQPTHNVLDNGLFYILKKHPEADQCSIRLKDEKSEPVDIQVRLKQNKTSDFYWYYFNQKNGQLDKLKSSKNLQLGSKITSMNYDLHTGSIGGLATKIISFIASLICASLPITGCIIWLNKLKKSRKRLPPNEN